MKDSQKIMLINNRRTFNKRGQRKNHSNKVRHQKHREHFRGREDPRGDPIKNKPIITRCLRYYFNDTTQSVILYNTDLLKLFGSVTSASTNFFSIISGIRLLRIGVNLLSNNSAGATTCSFTWEGTNSPSNSVSLYATQGVPARVSFYPPEDSLSGFWWNQASYVSPVEICTIDAQGISNEPVIYIDLEFQYVMASGICTNHSLTGASSFTGLGYRTIFQDTATAVGLDSVT